MPAPLIVFPSGATHARQTEEGTERIFTCTSTRYMSPNARTDFGIYANGKFTQLNEEQLQEQARINTPAFPAPKSAAQEMTKTKFITELLLKEPGKYTAKEIATMVVERFGGEFDKAIAFTRAVPWHLKQKGINATYKKENEIGEPEVVSVEPSLEAPESDGMS